MGSYLDFSPRGYLPNLACADLADDVQLFALSASFDCGPQAIDHSRGILAIRRLIREGRVAFFVCRRGSWRCVRVVSEDSACVKTTVCHIEWEDDRRWRQQISTISDSLRSGGRSRRRSYRRSKRPKRCSGGSSSSTASS